MPVLKTHKEKMLHRVKIIKGHVSAIERMLDKDKCCVDIVHQSMAVQKALKELDSQLIKEYVTRHPKDAATEKVLSDLVSLFKFK